MEEALQWILDLFAEWGLLLTFLGSALENIAVVGSFTPGDLVVVVSSIATAAKGNSLAAVAIVTILGVMVGNNITYAMFRTGGRALLLRVGDWFSKHKLLRRIVSINDETLVGTEEFFKKHGGKAVFLARFVTGFKSYIIAVAGISRMKLIPFQVYTFFSAVIYSIFLVTIGWFVGNNIDAAMSIVSKVGIIGLILFVGLFAFLTFRHSEKTEERLTKLATGDIQLTLKEMTSSTNDDVKELAHEGAPEGTVVAALQQLEGRGRRGKKWESPKGGLYMSLLLRPFIPHSCDQLQQHEPKEDNKTHQVSTDQFGAVMGLIPLVIGLGLIEELEEMGIENLTLKWPNDVLLDGKKLIGILCESACGKDGLPFVVCGWGINISHPETESSQHVNNGRLNSRKAYLSDKVNRLELLKTPEFANKLAGSVMTKYKVWLAETPDREALKSYINHLAWVGQSVSVFGEKPGSTITGTLVGVDEQGRLVLSVQGEEQKFSSGEVSLRKRGNYEPV